MAEKKLIWSECKSSHKKERWLYMKVFIVVAVIIVTICLFCLMKAKAEGDRIYDEIAGRYFRDKENRIETQTERYG